MVWLLIATFWLPVLALTGPIVIGSWHRAGWSVLDLLVVPLPGIAWYWLHAGDGRAGSVSQVVEIPVLAGLTVAALVLRALAPPRIPRIVRTVLLVVSLALATGGLHQAGSALSK